MTWTKPCISFLISCASLFVSGCASTGGVDDVEAFTTRFRAHAPHSEFQEARKIPNSPFWELVVEGTNIIYVTDDGRYVVSGELVDLAQSRSLPGDRSREIVRAEMAAVADKYTLVFGPDDAARTVTVFVDLECQHCERFVEDLSKLAGKEARFRVLFAPRGEFSSSAYRRAVALWCEPNPVQALAQAFRTVKTLTREETCPTPVFASRELARRLGIRRTPAFVLEDGRVVYGYTGVERLRKSLGLRSSVPAVGNVDTAAVGRRRDDSDASPGVRSPQ